MNFELTEYQKMIKSAARDFLAKECSKTTVREIQESEPGYSPELWRKMADLEWTSMLFPERYGGMEASPIDMAVLYEEMGRALLSSPHLSSVVLCGSTILRGGSEAIKDEFIPKIARGELCFTLALTEPDYGWNASSIATTATPEGSSYLIKGSKLFVPYANAADYILVTARTGDGIPEESISLFIVDTEASAGLNCISLHSSIAEPTGEVILNNVKVPASNMVGELNKGWPLLWEVIKLGIILQCAETIGGADSVLEMTINYSKDRIQFGQYIGSFPRVQDRIINMVNDLDKARWATYEAAWRLSESLPCDLEVSTAKVLSSAAYSTVCQESAHVHAGVGFMKDYDLWLYHKKAWAEKNYLGSPDFHRKIIARKLAMV
jgi:alkylation response protein AidB-like acyl-CoA dehydrogenase